MKLRIFGQIDSAHATLTDQRNNLVMGYSLSRFELTIGQHLSPSLICRRIHKVTGLFMGLQQ